MKRFLTIVLALSCLMAVCCPAFAVVECKVPALTGAGEIYATMGDLYQAWGGYEGYPDYICGVWSTDGGMTNLTVAVTDNAAGEQGRAEILAMIADPSTVTFTTQPYSYRELNAIMEEVTAQMGGDSLIIGCGVYEMDNTVHIMVNDTGAEADRLAKALSKQYGGKVLVEMSNPLYTTTVEDSLLTYGSQEEVGDRMPVLPTVAVLAAAVGAGLVFIKGRIKHKR